MIVRVSAGSVACHKFASSCFIEFVSRALEATSYIEFGVGLSGLLGDRFYPAVCARGLDVLEEESAHRCLTGVQERRIFE